MIKLRKKSCVLVLAILLVSIEVIMAIPTPRPLETLELPRVETFRGGKQFAFMLSWDDGWKDSEFSYIEDELNLKHTSFVVTERQENKLLWGLDLLFRGHDIQSHSHKHLHHAKLNSTYCEFLIRQSAEDIQNLYGFTPILFAYPYGSHSKSVQEIVLNYFSLARGIQSESKNSRGSWPIINVGCCSHSFPSVDGVKPSNMELLASTFKEMVVTADGEHRAYKCYGHTLYFSENERKIFFELIEEITNREDTWYVSWGEAIAYQLERDNLHIADFIWNKKGLSFKTELDDIFTFGIPLSYTIEIPTSWNEVSILDGDRITKSFRIYTNKNGKYIQLDSVPISQRINILSTLIEDNVSPTIQNFRTITTSEGVGFIVDISDSGGFVTDVNMTIKGPNCTYELTQIRNPLFWVNSTFGGILFTLEPGKYSIRIKAADSYSNIGFKDYNYSFDYIKHELVYNTP